MIAAVGLALMAGGQLMGGIASSKAQQQQALQYRIAAVRRRLQAETDARMIEDQGRRFQSNQAAAFAKSGVALDSGSPLAVLMDTAISVEKNAQRTRLSGEWAAEGLTAGASVYEKMASNSMLMGVVGAAGTFLSGAKDAQGDYSPSKAMKSPGVGSMGSGHNWNEGAGIA